MDSGARFGFLYNWFAATDARGIATTGWHVPTQAELETLITFLGGSTLAGMHLKSVSSYYWMLSSTTRGASSRTRFADNSSKFSAVGNGYRSGVDGEFKNIKTRAYFWTSTEYSGTDGTMMYLQNATKTTTISHITKTGGHAIRLLKDSTSLTDGQAGSYVGNDGHTYRSICIGTQEWLAENLCETKYANSDDITLVEDNSAWAALATEGYCAYDNEPINARISYPGVKYVLGFYDYFGDIHLVYFCPPNYSGSTTYLKGGKAPAVKQVEVSDVFTHSPIKATSLEMQIVELTEDVYIELFTVDKAARVEAYKNGVIYWRGWTTAQDYEVDYNQCPHVINVLAIDGLSFLKSIPLSMDKGDFTVPGIYPAKSYIYQALDEVGLVDMKIYDSLDLYAVGMDEDNTTLEETYLDTWSFYAYQKEDSCYKNLYTVLEEVLFVLMARIQQRNGNWYINHIDQFKDDYIVYRMYDSGFNEISEVVEESVVCQLTNSSSPTWPVNAPIYTLKKGLVRPFSKLRVKPQYRFETNMIRYPYDPNEVPEDIDYEFSTVEEHLLINGIRSDVPPVTGFVYSLGWVQLPWSDLVDPEITSKSCFDLQIKGKLRGSLEVLLYIVNEADGKTYYCTGNCHDVRFYGTAGSYIDGIEVGSSGYITASNTWLTRRTDGRLGNWSSEGDALNCFKALHIEKGSARELEDFDESMELTGCLYHQALKGQLYMMIVTPFFADRSAIAYIELDSLALTYTQGHEVIDRVYSSEIADAISNEMEVNPILHCVPYDEIYLNDNPQLSYPGLLYFKSGTHYTHCGYFMRKGVESVVPSSAGDNWRKIEEVMLESIMGFYSAIKWEIRGKILGWFDVGNVLQYKNRKYLIVSMVQDLHTSKIDVILIEIGTAGEVEEEGWLIMESGSEPIITEESEYIDVDD